MKEKQAMNNAIFLMGASKREGLTYGLTTEQFDEFTAYVVDALEKRVPKPPVDAGQKLQHYICGECGAFIRWATYFCPMCGQRIDWED